MFYSRCVVVNGEEVGSVGGGRWLGGLVTLLCYGVHVIAMKSGDVWGGCCRNEAGKEAKRNRCMNFAPCLRSTAVHRTVSFGLA